MLTKRKWLLLVVGLCVLCAPSLLAQEAPEEGETAPDGATKVLLYRHEGGIWGLGANLMIRAIERAPELGAELILIELDTPGGQVSAVEDMVKAILGSELPIVVFVEPRGADAASGGFFVLMASDVAVRAPITRTGAAHPVVSGGENKEGDILLKKIAEDLSALVRSAARERGRPAELAEKAVFEAKSWSSEEALELGLIDHIAATREELFDWLDGREIKRPDGSIVTVPLQQVAYVSDEYSWKDEFRSFLFHPAVLGLLGTIAVLGIYYEFSNPGAILPGVVAVVCILIILLGQEYMPINYFALGLLALAGVLFFLEIKVTSYGTLTLGGAVSLGVGLYLLFPREIPDLAVSVPAVVVTVLIIVAIVGVCTYHAAKAQRSKPTSGKEGMVGLVGEATTAIAPLGTVFVRGEYWKARAEREIEPGTPVHVVGSRDLLLVVEALEERR